MKGIITILLIFSIDAYTHGAPFDESAEWVSAIGKLGREQNSKERNPFVWMQNSERKRNGSNVEYLQWFVKNWKDNGEKNRKKDREKVSLNLSRLKNKSDSFDISSDSEQTKLRILSGQKKWNSMGKNSNEEQEEKEEEEESIEKMSDELSIRKKRYSGEKDSRERNSDKNDHRENNNFSESWNMTDETDSSSFERSNKYFDSRKKKRKRDSEEYDSRKSSSSGSSSWEFDSDEEKFNDYLKDLLKENQHYEEITEMLKNYKTNVYYERLYEWNKVKYLEWRKNIKLKNKILDEKENLSMEILRKICNVSTNIKRKEQENRLKDCVGSYISTKDKFKFTTDLSLVHFQDTNIKTDGEKSHPNRSSDNGHIHIEGMKNSSTNEEKSFDNGNRGATIDDEQKEKKEQQQETKSSSRKDEIDNDEKPTDRNLDNLTQLIWSSRIGTEERTVTTKDENLTNFENDTNRSEESNVIWSTIPHKYLQTESSEASKNRSTIFEESNSNVRDNDRNNDLNKNTIPSNNGNEYIRQFDNTESNGSEDLNINESTVISANQQTISRSTSRIEASTIWAKDGLTTISSIKFETIDNNDNFTTSSDINFTIATSNDINNNESFNSYNNVQPNTSSDKSNELRNKETIEASSRIPDTSSLSSVYQIENSQVATSMISTDTNNEQTATSTSQTINSSDFRDKDQIMETWNQKSGTNYVDNVSITANINIEINTVRTENETNTLDSSVANTQTASNSTVEKVLSIETLSPESEIIFIDISSNNEKADTDKVSGILENKSTTDANGWTNPGNSESSTARENEETTINYQIDDSIVTRKKEEAEVSNDWQTIFRGNNSNEQNVSVITIESNKTLIQDDNLIITDINEQTDSIVETISDNESTTKDAQIILSFSQTEKFDIFKTERSIDDQSKTTDFLNVTNNGNNETDENSTSIDESTIEKEEITTLSSENFIATEITMTQTISSQLPEIIIGTGDDIFENRTENENIDKITTLENLQTTSFSMQTEKSNTGETKGRLSIQTGTDSTAFTNEIEEIEAFSSNSKNFSVTEAELTTVKLSSKLENEFVTLENIETTSSFLQTLSNRSEANEPIEASSTRTEMILVDNSTIVSINVNDRTNKANNNLKDNEKSTSSVDKTDSNKFTTLKDIESDYSSNEYDNTTEAKAQTVKLEIIVSDINGTKMDNFIIIDSSNILDLFNVPTGNVKINSNVKEPNTPITDTQIYNTVISKAVTSAELIINSNPEPLVNEMPIKRGKLSVKKVDIN